jgi:hypothetical protein
VAKPNRLSYPQKTAESHFFQGIGHNPYCNPRWSKDIWDIKTDWLGVYLYRPVPDPVNPEDGPWAFYNLFKWDSRISRMDLEYMMKET